MVATSHGGSAECHEGFLRFPSTGKVDKKKKEKKGKNKKTKKKKQKQGKFKLKPIINTKIKTKN